MFQGWRIRLREAEESLQRGQLDEAYRLLLHSDLQQYLPGKRLSTKVANGLAERARQRTIHGDMEAGLRDLDAARSLVGVTDPLLNARQEIVEIALGEAENQLASGDSARAIALLETLEKREVRDEPVRTLKQVARHLESARHLGRRGKFAEAESQTAAAYRLQPKREWVNELRGQYREKMESSRQTTESLHRAMAAKDWTTAVRHADELLELAPECRLARDARRRAWEKVGARAGDSRSLLDTRGWHRAVGGGTSGDSGRDSGTDVAVADPATGRRFLLWIDGVGGYLVCLSDQIMLGQAMPRNRIDVPLLGDVSRRHAKIVRRGEGYVLEPLQRTAINGQSIRGITLLSDGDEIELAGNVRLQFRQAHPLSASARLDFVSHHRTQPTADGVLLMAESCVLGPGWRNHVVCRDWESDVVLYQRDDALCCRAMESIEIDGHLRDGTGQIGLNSRVVGNDFSLSLEELS